MNSCFNNYRWLYFVIVVFTLLTQRTFRDWFPVEHPFIHDVDQYYSYCIMAFVKNDLSYENQFARERGYWVVDTKKGKVQRFTMGISIMQAPFFLIGHVFSQIFDFKYDGYTAIYAFFISVGTLFYFFSGLYFLRLALLNYFSEKIVSITLFVIFLCTNLFYYTVGNGEMSHSYLFSLLCLYIYSTIKWYQTFQNRYLYYIAFLLGFVTLIRPIEILNVLFFLFFDMPNKFSNVIKLVHNFRYIVISITLFLILIFFQMLYWKIYGGYWIIYTYGKEGFFWLSPKIHYVLFSYRNGAIIYSPALIFSLIGFIFLYRHNKHLFYGSVVTFLVALYVVSCWWTWWYGGGFGNRALVEFYSYLSIPLASFIYYISDKIKFRFYFFNYSKNVLLVIVVLILFVNNLIRHYQKIIYIVHWDSMSKEAFWTDMWRLNLNSEERKEREKLYVTPKYEDALVGKRDY